MNRLIKWFALNTIFALCLYFGLYENIDGARNVAIFIAWFCFSVSLFALHEDVINSIKSKGRSVPVFVDVTFDLSVIFALVWSGWIITAIAYVIHAMIIFSAHEKEPKESK